MINFRSYYDLSRDIAANIAKIPRVDVVVGVPRSGLIPATMISAFLNVPLYDLETFLFMNGPRSGFRKTSSGKEQEVLKVLIVDDSLNTGAEMRRVQARVEHLGGAFDITYCAVYGTDDELTVGNKALTLTILPAPRVFQWNYRSHIIASHACYDMDGVLCVDPTDDENDDGERYIRFILEAQPLFIPRKKISAIVTSRLEKFRPYTEEWLHKHGVQYGELIMLDLPNAEARRKAKAHAPFKTEVYKGRSEIIFVESNWKQARFIAENSKKPVICTENDAFLTGRESGVVSERIFPSQQIYEEAELLRTELSRLKSAWANSQSKTLSKEVEKLSREIKPPLKAEKIRTDVWIRERLIRTSQSAQMRPERRPGSPLRVVMLAYSFDKKIGAGAAESSTRLKRALQKIGIEVHALEAADFGDSIRDTAGQPASGARIGFWNSFYDAEHSRSLRRRIEEIAPDVILLGAVDRGVISLVDIAALNFPIVWVNRDNWAHTGGCLFQLGDMQLKHAPPVDDGFLDAINCGRYTKDCSSCPAISDKNEGAIARIQFEVKQLVYSMRQDIVFAPISPWLARTMELSSLTKSSEIQQIYNPIDLDLYKPSDRDQQTLRTELGLPTSGTLVLLAAQNVENKRKGVALVEQAIRRGLVPDGVKFVLMGGGANGKGSISTSQKLIYLGFVGDDAKKAKIYSAVNLTLVPALQESLSVVASDSLCCGTPVVAFRTGGLGDIVRHRETGYLAEPFSIEDLMAGVRWVQEHNDLESIRSAARRSAEELFDERKNAHAYEGVLRLAIERFKVRSGPVADTTLLETLLGSMQSVLRYRKSVENKRKVAISTRAVTSEIDGQDGPPKSEAAQHGFAHASNDELSVANRLLRAGQYKEALALYEKLYSRTPLPIYLSNIELAKRRMSRVV